MWRLVCCAMQGSGHKKSGVPCQDKTFRLNKTTCMSLHCRTAPVRLGCRISARNEWSEPPLNWSRTGLLSIRNVRMPRRPAGDTLSPAA